ncbi:MAG: TonB family protein [Pyrinomonadaceae bacterium]
MRVITSAVCFCLIAFALTQTIRAQDQLATSSGSARASTGSKEEDKLNGQVRRVRVETAKLLVKEGKTVEGPRLLREITTYNPSGQKIDSVSYPAQDSTPVGKQEYLYDPKGNVIEMTLLGDDGSILNKEKYDYEFDEFGNWGKKTASMAVYENGTIAYEPSEITYRTITYYYTQLSAATATATSNTSALLTDRGIAATTKPPANEPASVAPAPIATTDAKRTSNSEEAVVTGLEKREPSVAASPVVTPHDDARKLTVIRMSEEALRMAAIDLPQPQYPEAALISGAEGNVEVQILVDEKGEVMNASVLSGNPLFSEVAAAAARKARFSPAKLSPDPARIYGVINYTFTLPRDKSAPPSANGSASKPKTSQPSEGLSDVRILLPGDSSGPVTNNPTEPLPSKTSAYLEGLTFLESGRNAEAVEALRKATERDPNDAAAYAKLGLAYAAMRQYQEAVVVLKIAIRIKPEVVGAEEHYQLSTAYTALGKFPLALEAIKQSLYAKRAEQANPEVGNTPSARSMADLHYAAGLAYYNLRRYSAAIEELKQVISLNPKNAQAYYGLALTYLATGDRKAAEKQQASLESLDPVFAAKVAKLLSSNPNNPQGFGFVFKNDPK